MGARSRAALARTSKAKRLTLSFRVAPLASLSGTLSFRKTILPCISGQNASRKHRRTARSLALSPATTIIGFLVALVLVPPRRELTDHRRARRRTTTRPTVDLHSGGQCA